MECLKNLHWKNEDELVALGYYRDDIGQVRRKIDNALICGISGRAHFHHLVPVPDYDPKTSQYDILFIDEQEVRNGKNALIKNVKIKGREVVENKVAQGIQRVGEIGLKFALEKLFEKLGKVFK